MATVTGRPAAATEEARAAERRRRRRRSAWRRQLLALAFMSPWIIGFCAFFVYPVVSSLYFSFTRYDILTDPVWVGLFSPPCKRCGTVSASCQDPGSRSSQPGAG